MFKSILKISFGRMFIPLIDVDWRGFSGTTFGERDSDVVATIGEEDLSVFTFDGLKRRLGLHSETLSRVLARLEEEGLVKKSPQGYVVTSKMDKLVKMHAAHEEVSRVSLVQTFLPSDISIEQLVSDLRGRWFGLLRWLGLAENGEGVTLKWITEEGDVQIEAKIAENTLTITAKFLRSNDLNLALKAAYQLMSHIGKRCARPHPAKPMVKPVSYFGGADFFLTSA
jgi:DNA-binding transcriptional regulator YhcF (GntR family)